MANITTYLRDKLLDHSLGTTSFTMPTQLYAGLYIATPTISGGGTEVSAPDYARVPVTFSGAVSGSTTNNASIRWPAAGTTSSSWGTVVTVGLLDSLVTGNLYWFGPLSANIVMNTGSDFLLAPGELTISFA